MSSAIVWSNPDTTTATISWNEILTGLDMPEDYTLTIVMIDAESVDDRYVRNPFTREPDFGATRVNDEPAALLALFEKPE
jgi:hypothetical protein